MMLLLVVMVHLSYFRKKPLSSGGWENNKGLTPFTALFLCCCSGSWRVNVCCVTNFLCFFLHQKQSLFQCIFICSYLIKHFHGQLRRRLSRYYHYGAFVLLLLLLLSIMPIDSRTWYARIGVFQSTKIVTQSNNFQKDNLNFTVQNIAFMYNKMSIKFFLILFYLMWVLLKINFDILITWSVIAKYIKSPLMSTHSSCKNVFTK